MLRFIYKIIFTEPRIDFFALAFLLLISGCSSPNNNPVGGISSNQTCNLNIPPSSSTYLCDVYHNNIAWQCDAAIRKELIKRNQILYPSEQCGRSSKNVLSSSSSTTTQNNSNQICVSDFSASSSDYLCDTYHKNKWTQCDTKISNEILNRGLKLNPANQCGQKEYREPVNATANQGATQCDVMRFATDKLCDDYWNSRNLACHYNIIAELNKRGWKHQPKSACGIIPLVSIPDIDAVPPQYKFPSKVIPGCDAVMQRIKINANPILTACNLHHRSLEVDSIKCKGNIDEFLKLNSKGVGKSFSNCGIQE